MKHALLVLALLFALVGSSIAQTSDKAKRAAETMDKFRQVDVLTMLLPMVLTKEQIRKILPDIEKARQDVKKQEQEEADLILKYSERVDQAIKAGVDEGEVPKSDLLREMRALVQTMTMKRRAVASDNVDLVFATVKKVLNEGQLKAAANSLRASDFMPADKAEALSEDDKVKLFVREILLEPHAYEILVKMQAGKRG
ncbi:MAG: hypothetical protein J0H02_09100 [Armatimonadetes bacterium]|nr:hypothetical protein [Armatimonadota bacterium]